MSRDCIKVSQRAQHNSPSVLIEPSVVDHALHGVCTIRSLLLCYFFFTSFSNPLIPQDVQYLCSLTSSETHALDFAMAFFWPIATDAAVDLKMSTSCWRRASELKELDRCHSKICNVQSGYVWVFFSQMERAKLGNEPLHIFTSSKWPPNRRFEVVTAVLAHFQSICWFTLMAAAVNDCRDDGTVH